MQPRSVWYRLSTWLCLTWTVLVLGLVANRFMTLPTFEQAAADPCPTFLLQLAPQTERALLRLHSSLSFRVFSWQNRKSREIIDPFRKGDRALNCDVLSQRAQLFLTGSRLGAIEPGIRFHTKTLIALIVLPCCLIIIVSHLPLGRGVRAR